MIEDLFTIQLRIVKNISLDFKRYLYHYINWDHRLIIISGSRGTGKSTLILQYYLEKFNDVKKCLYISADHPIVLKEGIYSIVNEYFQYYGNCVIIDEVHKHKDWSLQIKAIYDSFPDKKIIILGSSALNIIYEKGDLSRRGILYNLLPLSFREYLEIKKILNINPQKLDNLLDYHIDFSMDILNQNDKILKHFADFLRTGNLPFCLNYKPEEYYTLLMNTLDKIIYEDIPTIKSLRGNSSLKIKTLIGYIATSKIPVFNIESLTNEIKVAKDTLYDYFHLLEKSEILEIIRTKRNKINLFKNSKIFFLCPNFYYAIASDLWKSEPNLGNIRESFFSSQVSNFYPIVTSQKVDFKIYLKDREIEVEIGGKGKTNKQLKSVPNGYLFTDGIEIGYGKTIPLYLSGFLY